MDAFEYDPPVNDPARYNDGPGPSEQDIDWSEFDAEDSYAEAYADAYLAQWDDDPSPYDGNYSEM